MKTVMRALRLVGAARRGVLLALIAVMLGGLPAPVAAQNRSALAQIVDQLEDQGFTIVSVRQTWLGRTRILARSGAHHREIVFVPSTGEILRDYWDLRAGSGSGRGGGSGNSGPGPGGHDDDDDDDEDDESDEDNSGPGSTNSGSGGGSDHDEEEDD